jgi:glycosyltransferase involved in cell wall biosynthesis
MAAQYAGAHVTVAPFVRPDQCKPVPNSLVESLACGRPVLATPQVGLAELIREERVGAVVEPQGQALAEGLDLIRREWAATSARARRTAERRFALPDFLEAYHRVYQELVA